MSALPLLHFLCPVPSDLSVWLLIGGNKKSVGDKSGEYWGDLIMEFSFCQHLLY
jgi:hypothetical protein